MHTKTVIMVPQLKSTEILMFLTHTFETIVPVPLFFSSPEIEIQLGVQFKCVLKQVELNRFSHL
jgi:hypothetical protein